MLSHLLNMPKSLRGSLSFFTWSSHSYFTRPPETQLLPSLASSPSSSTVYLLFTCSEMGPVWGTDTAFSLEVKSHTFWVWPEGLSALSPMASLASSPQMSSLTWFQSHWPFSSWEMPHCHPLRPFAGMPHPSHHMPTQLMNFYYPEDLRAIKSALLREAFQASPEQAKFS